MMVMRFNASRKGYKWLINFINKMILSKASMQYTSISTWKCKTIIVNFVLFIFMLKN